MKLGVLREGKVPPDKRVPFTPAQCLDIMKRFPGTTIIVQSSPFRCFPDSEYEKLGIEVREDLSDCDILFGIKEVPVQNLVPEKKYLFFSHTIKKQPHNRELLRAILTKKIQLIDYECLTDKDHNRIIGFGRWAGIVGAYNGIRAYGEKFGVFHIKPAHQCKDKTELSQELQKVKLPSLKIIITGGGRVANGATEIMGALKIRRVTPYEFLHYNFEEPVYVKLHSKDYHKAKDKSEWNSQDFYKYPENYISTFKRYTSKCDILMHCAFWDPKAPVLFTKEDMKSSKFHIRVIADITCDINGSIPSTHRATTIPEPFYDYNTETEEEIPALTKENITVMSIDNLPCELPRDASEDFGKNLIDQVLPSLLGTDTENIIERATITRNGHLTEPFSYLSGFVK